MTLHSSLQHVVDLLDGLEGIRAKEALAVVLGIQEVIQFRLDAPYTERNTLVALLSTMFPAGTAKTAIAGWDPSWHNCVYIDFPWGQAAWHYHDKDAHLFDHLGPYDKPYDGHTTDEKYAAIRAATKGKV